MDHQFSHHYSVDEARKLLPQIRQWLDQLQEARDRLQQSENQLQHLLAAGDDVGGRAAQERVKAYAAVKGLLGEFHRREIQIKDLDRGLIDFPAIVGGREVFLCWESDEEDIEFWHDLDAGYGGREPIL